MKIILGGQYLSVLEGSSVRIQRAMSDPVPTCTLRLRDNASSITPQAMQELLVLDDQQIPNPTQNTLLNPALNPYTSKWTTTSFTGITLSQNGGGGLVATCSNAPLGTSIFLAQNSTVIPWYPTPGQAYMFSCYVQGSGTISFLQARISIQWFDFAGNSITTAGFTASPLSTSLVRYSVQSTAPTNAGYAQVQLSVQTTSSSNSGVVTFTQPQFEPVWFPTIPYPTPWCGPSQTNCQQLPLGYYIRQYRKFAGFVTHTLTDNYHGNVRQVQVDAVGYAWLLGTIICNNSYTNQTDAAIISNLLSTYLPNLTTTTNVVTGVTISDVQSNWDDLRTIFDGLAGLSGFYWTIDFYWNVVYAPPGYYAMPISLICDNSSQPNFTTTYPGYNFTNEQDYTQPGSSILIIGGTSGSTTFVAKVQDPSSTEALRLVSGYPFSSGVVFQRKINDSTLLSTNDCTQRGMAELLIYDYPRGIYHVNTNVELIPGQSIQVTSASDSLNQSTQLIQQVTASWIGTNETLTDEWEYVSDLGATNRGATNIISRIHRITQKNTAAPAIQSTTLATIERVGVVDTIDSNSNYAETVLADSPVLYWRLGEPTGFSITTAYDWSGNTTNGTINGNTTLGTAGLLYNDTNTAMTFDGSTGFVNTSTNPITTSANHPWALECWIKPNASQSVTQPTFFWAQGIFFLIDVTQGYIGEYSGTGNMLATNIPFTPGNTYYCVLSYDGSNIIAYIGSGGPLASQTLQTSATPTVTTNGVRVGTDNVGDPYAGVVDEAAIYNAPLPISQVFKHYAAGTGKLLGNLYTAYSLYAGTVYTDKPIAYYRLDETGTGTTAYDWQTNNLIGTLNGGITLGSTSLLFNDSDGAMTFNGSTGYIQLPSVGAWPTGNGQWTIECWCKPANSTNANNGHMITLGNPGTNSAVASICQTATGGWGVVTWGGPGHDFHGNGTSVAGTTYYVAATYDGTNLRVYVGTGGTLTTYGPFSPGTLALTTSAHQSIGDAWNGSAQAFFFNGVIDEPACYGVALSQSRLQAHYNVGALGHL